jgi:hypothetical protein
MSREGLGLSVQILVRDDVIYDVHATTRSADTSSHNYASPDLAFGSSKTDSVCSSTCIRPSPLAALLISWAIYEVRA